VLSDEQRAFRASGLGGSDVAELVSGSPSRVYGSKALGLELEDSLPLKIGRHLEAGVRALYQEETGAELLGPGLVRHPKESWAIGSLDDRARRDGVERVVELKTASFRVAHQWGEGDEVPERYLVQVQWYMGVTGLPRADLAVLLGGADFRVYALDADPELFGHLLEIAGRFWRDHVVAKCPPPPDASEACAEVLRALHPRDSGPEVPATPELAALVDELRQLKANAKAIETREKALRHRLVAAIGDAAGVEGLCSYRAAKGRPSVRWEEVCREAGVPPALVEKWTMRSPYRVLRLKNGGGDE
jgi:putative phage-type endonuclease